MRVPARTNTDTTAQIYAEMLSETDKQKLARLYTDFRYFAYRMLWVVDKEGKLVKFKFNDAQELYHRACEAMLAEVGFIRMIVLKGRQQGISTYITARGYWIALTRSYKSICILAHDEKTTKLLFDKVEIYRDNTREPLKPKTDEDNKNSLIFFNKSRFYILTAGSGQAGRGSTAQFRHESERAQYKKVSDIDSGVGQNVADVPGTEVHRESTAWGFNFFQKEYTQAVQRKGKFRAVFIPWYLQREYTSPARPDFERTEVEERIARHYNLNNDQLQWRRDMIIELKDLKVFRREYPLNDVEAFQASGGSFFDSDYVMAARRRTLIGTGPVVISCDPAGQGGDRTVIVFRRGRHIFRIEVYNSMEDDRLIQLLADFIDEYDAVKCFIDAGYGHSHAGYLRANGYRDIVMAVHFSGQAADPDMHADKRAEMLFKLRDWMKDGRIPDDPEGEVGIGSDISQDLGAIPEPEGTPFRFQSKKQIKKEYGRSPDICDAMMLQFAFPIREKDILGARNRQRSTRSQIRSAPPTNASQYRGRKEVRRGRQYGLKEAA